MSYVAVQVSLQQLIRRSAVYKQHRCSHYRSGNFTLEAQSMARAEAGLWAVPQKRLFIRHIRSRHGTQYTISWRMEPCAVLAVLRCHCPPRPSNFPARTSLSGRGLSYRYPAQLAMLSTQDRSSSCPPDTTSSREMFQELAFTDVSMSSICIEACPCAY